jgi:predicted metal-dependent phosphoesterase TrpH
VLEGGDRRVTRCSVTEISSMATSVLWPLSMAILYGYCGHVTVTHKPCHLPLCMGLYKIDTHIHTSRSSCCAIVSGREIVHWYKDAGYYGVVITDHFARDYSMPSLNATWEERIEHFLAGYREAYAEGRKIGFVVLLGMELRFTENPNDYLVYGIDEEFLMGHEDFYEMGLASFKKLASENGILIYQAHPFRPVMQLADPAFLDGVEVFNGAHTGDYEDNLAYEFAKAHNLLMLSGSDFHSRVHLARGGIILSEEVHTSQELAKVLRENRNVELIRGERIKPNR